MDKQNLILQYFEQTLSNEDLQLFNDLIKTDKAFVDEVAFQQQLKAAIHLQKRQEIKQQLQQLDSFSNTKTLFRKWFYIAATFILIIGSGVWLFFQKPDVKQLFATYYQPYPNTILPIVRGNNNTQNTFDAFRVYDNQDYEKASILFDKLFEKEQKEYALFYKAICLLQINKTTEAVDILKNFKFTSNEFIIMSKWYLAMAYLKLNDKTAAIPLVKFVSENDNPFQNAATNLLKKLNK